MRTQEQNDTSRRWRRSAAGAIRNDVHSKLNRTRVAECLTPDSVEAVAAAIDQARRRGSAVSIAGGCHAMGGQQFGRGTLNLDLGRLRRVLNFDAERGLVEVEAGIQWPELMRSYLVAQQGRSHQWGIRQKQTGADRLSIGGAIAANIHGRCLASPPFVGDVESFRLVGPDGEIRDCSRTLNPELFRLVVGGYGLFGVVVSATLRLVPRRKVQRVVRLIELDELADAFAERIGEGYLYGDFQFATDAASSGFLQRGVFSCYRPVDSDRPIPPGQIRLTPDDWQALLRLAHEDKSRAFERFTEFYLATTGQLYWSDTHQLSLYLDDYHEALDPLLGSEVRGTEMITELYVPRERLGDFMAEVREDFRVNEVDLIYGTVRLIERDRESFLAWAREDAACVIFNLHVAHTLAGWREARAAFRRLIDIAIRYGGSYFLTYHRFASAEQLLACYPRFPEFLRRKRHYDPEQRFQSDWYRHYSGLLEPGPALSS